MQEIAILGAGESGIGAAILARKQKLDFFVSDLKEIPENQKHILQGLKATFEEGQHSFDKLKRADLVVKSPGIPDSAPIVVQLKEHGIPVVSEIEFAARYTHAMIIGITGTNGKSTTTLLTGHLLRQGGLDACTAGNVGNSFAAELAKNDHEYFVLELSSFQLDDIDVFRPHIAAILNISPDHLDRYEYDMQKYAAAKFRIAENQTPADYLLVNGSDPILTKWLEKDPVAAQVRTIDMPEVITGPIRAGEASFSLENPALRGRHNRFNARCAVEIGRLLSVPAPDIQAGLDSFVNEAHRLERVGVFNDVEYINDSKATNVEATYYALEAMEKPVIWIVGGQDKGNEYKILDELVQQKVKALICLGLDNEKIKAHYRDVDFPIRETKTAKKAVETAQRWATAGDVVLLSPACASFDLFKNYMDRGDKFKQAVKAQFGKT